MATQPNAPEHVRFAREARDPYAQAAEMGVDVAGLDRDAARRKVGDEKAGRFYDANREAIDAMNRWVENHGLPLAKYRLF